MAGTFINKEIEIDAPASGVWDVLVKRRYIIQWAREFSEGTVVTSDWQLGSSIDMTDDDGTIFMNGKITVFEPHELLQVEFEDNEYSERLELSAKEKTTLLSAKAGPVKESEYEEHVLAWEKGLRKIKALSEQI